MPKTNQRVAPASRGSLPASRRKSHRTCLRCRCTDARACADGCSWISPLIDICSACIRPAERPLIRATITMQAALVDISELPKRLHWPQRGNCSANLLAGLARIAHHLHSC